MQVLGKSWEGQAQDAMAAPSVGYEPRLGIWRRRRSQLDKEDRRAHLRKMEVAMVGRDFRNWPSQMPLHFNRQKPNKVHPVRPNSRLTRLLEPFTAHTEPSTLQAHPARPTKAGEQHLFKIPPTEMLPSAWTSPWHSVPSHFSIWFLIRPHPGNPGPIPNGEHLYSLFWIYFLILTLGPNFQAQILAPSLASRVTSNKLLVP